MLDDRSWSYRCVLGYFREPSHKSVNRCVYARKEVTHLFPSKFRKFTIVFWEFLTSWGFAWFPMYCSCVVLNFVYFENIKLVYTQSLRHGRKPHMQSAFHHLHSLCNLQDPPLEWMTQMSVRPHTPLTFKSPLTLFKTEIDAYVFPKLMPTTVGDDLVEVGVPVPVLDPLPCAILEICSKVYKKRCKKRI